MDHEAIGRDVCALLEKHNLLVVGIVYLWKEEFETAYGEKAAIATRIKCSDDCKEQFTTDLRAALREWSRGAGATVVDSVEFN